MHEKIIKTIVKLVDKYPNDADLGKKIRDYINSLR